VSAVQSDTPEATSGIVTALKVTSLLLALGLIVQAWLGSSGFYQGEPNRVDAHEMAGNVFFLVAVIQLVLAFVASQRRLVARSLIVISALLVLDVVAQLGLGYSGRESAGAMALHLPNGVLLMGLCTASVAQVWGFSLARRADHDQSQTA
jgi:hypothetical protein